MKTNQIAMFDLFSSKFKKDAYSIYHQLRTENPVHQITMPTGKTAWIISRYQDAIQILKDLRYVKNFKSFLNEEHIPLPPTLSTHMLNMDPPDHTRLRSFVQKAFTPRAIEQLREQIKSLSNTLLDRLEQKEVFDIIEDYAYPLPILVISEMLGIPEEDRTQFREWSNAIVQTSNHPEQMKRIATQINEFIQYLAYLVEKRRQTPGTDLITTLIQAESEDDKLTVEELFSMIFLLIVAGHETTVNLIGNGVYTLLEHHDALEKLRNNPEYIESTIEEVLRFSSPVEITTNRWANETISLHGKTIKQGDMVLISIASANRDPEAFSNPGVFDITRTNNKHIAFGAGIHYCVGASLARLEGQIAIQTLLHRYSTIKLGIPYDALEYQPGILMRGFVKLPIII